MKITLINNRHKKPQDFSQIEIYSQNYISLKRIFLFESKYKI